MIKTRKRIILSLFLLMTSFCIIDSLLLAFQDNIAVTNQQIFDTALPSTETISHKKRMRKPSTKKEKIKKIYTYKDMEYDQLVIAKNVQVDKKNISVAIKYLEQIMKLCTDVTQIADHLLELAELFFIDGQFKKASHLFTQYCNVYRGSPKQEYALCQAIKSSFACILPSDRDQTKTEETLALIDLFLGQDFTYYKDEVSHIQIQCYQNLAVSECNICNFYLARGKLAAVEKRLSQLRSTWLPKLSNLEPIIVDLEAQLNKQKEEKLLLTMHQNKSADLSKTKHMMERF